MSADVYRLQNCAIHAARQQLEGTGVLDPWSGLEQIRDMAAEINLGKRSISSLNLEQRSRLIDRLIEMGADVKNPRLYESDLKAEADVAGRKRKVLGFSRVSEKQLRMVDALAAQIRWYHDNGYTRLCEKLFKAPRPKNTKEVNQLAIVLRGMLERQNKKLEKSA